MEIIENCSEMLANRQVLDMLKDQTTKNQTNLATILYETTAYLESGPTATSTISDMADFLNLLKERKYDLTKLEKIQLVNLKPKNETELLIAIDNIEDKLNEHQRADLLQLIESHLEKPVVEAAQHAQKRHKTQ